MKHHIVSYLGPEATFTHTATKRHFGEHAKLNPCRNIPEIFKQVEVGHSVYGVVPIENSIEGMVSHTLDSFMNTKLSICAEVTLPISHHLLSRSGRLENITKIYSHPQALAQCHNWINNNLPNARLIDVSSTAEGALKVLENVDRDSAAVASDFAATTYNLHIAATNIEDVSNNITRFLVIGQEHPELTGNDRTSIMFALKNQPGILYRALEPFAKHGINMSRIESRPSPDRIWDYLFFIDLEGHRSETKISEAINELRSTCEFVKILGSYPRPTK